jgi:hypothetical protein
MFEWRRRKSGEIDGFTLARIFRMTSMPVGPISVGCAHGFRVEGPTRLLGSQLKMRNQGAQTILRRYATLGNEMGIREFLAVAQRTGRCTSNMRICFLTAAKDAIALSQFGIE